MNQFYLFQLHLHNACFTFLHTCSAVSNSLQSHGLQQARLLCPWDFPGKNTGVGCFSYSRGSSQPRYQTLHLHVSGTDRWILYHCANWEAHHLAIIEHYNIFCLYIKAINHNWLFNFSITSKTALFFLKKKTFLRG